MIDNIYDILRDTRIIYLKVETLLPKDTSKTNIDSIISISTVCALYVRSQLCECPCKNCRGTNEKKKTIRLNINRKLVKRRRSVSEQKTQR